MDGFVAAYRIGRGLGGLPNPLGYYDERDLPFAWNLADRYVLFDRFFSSARGGSVWNHLFAVTATAGQPPARTSCRRRAIRTRPRSSTGSRLRASRGASTSRTTTRRTRSPIPSLGERASQLLQVPLLAMPRVRAFAATHVAYRRYAGVLPRCAGRTASRGLVHRAGRRQRAPAGEARRRADIRALDRQRADAEPRMEQHRVRAHLRQLGRLV